ncbi:MAG TPA: hypothetical protein GX390_04245 [Acholeplasmataceae bacterium]|jgi:hypothetical protein|nr:hypothetical protein [Acholeplasmataceae bacterium]
MKIKTLLILLIAIVLSSCDPQQPPTPSDFEIETGLYAVEECVYLAPWFSTTRDAQSQGLRGIAAIELDDKYTCVPEMIKQDIDPTAFAFSLNNDFDIDTIIKRYDLHLNGRYAEKTLFVDGEGVIYLAICRVTNNGNLLINFVWRISKESAYLETGKLLGEEGLYRYTDTEFRVLIAQLQTLEEKTGELATLIAELESVLPLENAVESKDEPFHATYLIGDNLVLCCDETGTGAEKAMSFELLCFKRYSSGYGLRNRIFNVKYFEEFIDNYYDNEYIGDFIYRDAQNEISIRFSNRDDCAIRIGPGMQYKACEYRIENGLLIIESGDGKTYCFVPADLNLVFRADLSDAEIDIPDHAVFVPIPSV